MTIDDDSSVYVGGLPYDATESSISRVFSLYGAVVAVKIVNDHTTRGKCYGFVTFTNPRSACDAINDMNGRTINGRVVRVNEVTTRGGRSNFNRDRFRHSEWDRGRDRERDYGHDREQYRDRYSDRSREHDWSWDHDSGRERGYEHDDHDGAGEYSLDRDHDRDVEDNVHAESRDHIHEREMEHDLNLDQHREISGANGYPRNVDEDKEQQLRRRNGSMSNDQHGRGLSSDSSDDYNQMKKELERSIQNREELKTEISLMEGRLEETKQIVLDLQKKSKTLEDALVAAKKLSSCRKMQLTKLHKRFLQVKEYREKLKSCEQELQSLVDSAMLESEDDVAVRGGSLANGTA
ncbi:zinc finger CCCH domain-containing protein 25-like isoform X2 [Durio zibethinus]|uniref:Zinc finger CCCH domain-containing protein 25-like isoform X2 n=1 Tax=Durio zibethinus TaxID=66656 RepID=A0A6P5XUE1_DURZI|nr:zinc finger CCCH domain-containing protein 25-like isoform X2 [Durio zibethinus]